jgi:hypothetical protein
MRPKYESEEHLAREEAVAQRVMRAWCCESLHHPFGEYSCIDYAMSRDGEIKAYCEIRCRSHRMGTYPTLMFSKRKWEISNWIAAYDGVPYLLIVDFSGQLAYLKGDETTQYPVQFTGRNQMRDPYDKEECVMLPIDKFVTVAW